MDKYAESMLIPYLLSLPCRSFILNRLEEKKERRKGKRVRRGRGRGGGRGREGREEKEGEGEGGNKEEGED